jgi:hypothetical protein
MTTYYQLCRPRYAAEVRTKHENWDFWVILTDDFDDEVEIGIGSSDWHVSY